MAAARSLVDSSEGPELLGGYMTLHRWAQPETQYTTAAAGAKSIRRCTGVTDHRSKRVLRELLSLRYGERGDLFFIEPTGRMVKHAQQYRFGTWLGDTAYVPDLLIQGDDPPLIRLCQADESPEIRRDALLMLLHTYAQVDYGEFMGVDPALFAYQDLISEGSIPLGDSEIDLGYAGEHNGLNFWLIAEDPNGRPVSTPGIAAKLYGQVDDAVSRFWAAHALLLQIGMLSRVLLVEGREPWPLWVGSPAYREGIIGSHVDGDLAHSIYQAVDRARIDSDNAIIQQAIAEKKRKGGTGTYFVVTTTPDTPVVKTIYCPTFHAPTPNNLDGLKEMGIRTTIWQHRLDSAKKAKVA